MNHWTTLWMGLIGLEGFYDRNKERRDVYVQRMEEVDKAKHEALAALPELKRNASPEQQQVLIRAEIAIRSAETTYLKQGDVPLIRQSLYEVNEIVLQEVREYEG